MSLSILVSCIKELAEFKLSMLSITTTLFVTDKLTITTTLKCDGFNQRCHGYDYKKCKRFKLPCMNCPCKLFKCRYCKDLLWEDEDENENEKGACYGCSVGDPFSEPRIEEDEYYY